MNFLSIIIVKITSNLTFTRVSSQNPRECASQARVLCSWAEVLCLLVRMRELRVPRMCVHCEWKYYTCTYGTNQSSHAHMRAYSHSRTHTHTLLASTRTLLASAALTAHERCIDRSWALAPPSRERALSCLWSALYMLCCNRTNSTALRIAAINGIIPGTLAPIITRVAWERP